MPVCPCLKNALTFCSERLDVFLKRLGVLPETSGRFGLWPGGPEVLVKIIAKVYAATG